MSSSASAMLSCALDRTAASSVPPPPPPPPPARPPVGLLALASLLTDARAGLPFAALDPRFHLGRAGT